MDDRAMNRIPLDLPLDVDDCDRIAEAVIARGQLCREWDEMRQQFDERIREEEQSSGWRIRSGIRPMHDRPAKGRNADDDLGREPLARVIWRRVAMILTFGCDPIDGEVVDIDEALSAAQHFVARPEIFGSTWQALSAPAEDDGHETRSTRHLGRETEQDEGITPDADSR